MKVKKIEAVVGQVQVYNDKTDIRADIHLASASDKKGRPTCEDGDPWFTVRPTEYNGLWPPQVGDMVTCTIPQLVSVKRK